MANVKPSPWGIAVGAVAYAVAFTFHKQLPVEVLLALPASAVAVASAIEKGVEEVDPKATATIDRLNAQAANAARDFANVATDVVNTATAAYNAAPSAVQAYVHDAVSDIPTQQFPSVPAYAAPTPAPAPQVAPRP